MKYALIIGNSKYDDPKLAQLKTPQSDARALARVLKAKRIGSFDQVVLLTNQTDAQIRRAISTFLADKKPDDLVLLYFSGHGVLDGRGNLFLALKNTDVSALNATAISSSFVSYEMDNCRSRRQILILDCCHSGAFARGAKGAAQTAVTESTFEGSGSGRVVLTASDSTQFAFEGDQILSQTETKFSVFTHFLLEGLKTGRADRDMDGKISLDEWYDYCYAAVTAETPGQIPHKWSYRQQGDLIIAQNPFVIKKEEPKAVRLRAMLEQKQRAFQQHGLLLEADELEILASDLRRTKLDLQELDKRLILFSAVAHDAAQTWYERFGNASLDWLRRAVWVGKLPRKVRLGAVRFLAGKGDEQTYFKLKEMIEKDSDREEGLQLLSQFLHYSPTLPTLPWRLKGTLFPRLVRLVAEEAAPMRARLNRGIQFLVPLCVIILFGAFSLSDPQSNFWFLLLSVLVFSGFGILMGMVFAWAITTLALIKGFLPPFILGGGTILVGSLLGVILFPALTGSTEVWKANALSGAVLAGVHTALLRRRFRYWMYAAVLVALGMAVLVYGASVSESSISKLGEALSAGLFSGGYVYLAATARQERSAYN